MVQQGPTHSLRDVTVYIPAVSLLRSAHLRAWRNMWIEQKPEPRLHRAPGTVPWSARREEKEVSVCANPGCFSSQLHILFMGCSRACGLSLSICEVELRTRTLSRYKESMLCLHFKALPVSRPSTCPWYVWKWSNLAILVTEQLLPPPAVPLPSLWKDPMRYRWDGESEQEDALSMRSHLQRAERRGLKVANLDKEEKVEERNRNPPTATEGQVTQVVVAGYPQRGNRGDVLPRRPRQEAGTV